MGGRSTTPRNVPSQANAEIRHKSKSSFTPSNDQSQPNTRFRKLSPPPQASFWTNAIVNSAVKAIKNFKHTTNQVSSFCPGIAVLIGFDLWENERKENNIKQKIVLTKLVLNLFPIISNRTVRETH